MRVGSMSAMPAQFEMSFADALLNADRPVPCGITAHNAAIPTPRFAVYRNNVAAGLRIALQSRFPVVEKIIGEEFFAAMAPFYISEQPPRPPHVTAYADELPAPIPAF